MVSVCLFCSIHHQHLIGHLYQTVYWMEEFRASKWLSWQTSFNGILIFWYFDILYILIYSWYFDILIFWYFDILIFVYFRILGCWDFLFSDFWKIGRRSQRLSLFSLDLARRRTRKLLICWPRPILSGFGCGKKEASPETGQTHST